MGHFLLSFFPASFSEWCSDVATLDEKLLVAFRKHLTNFRDQLVVIYFLMHSRVCFGCYWTSIKTALWQEYCIAFLNTSSFAGHWGRCVGDCGSGGIRSRAIWCTHVEGWTTYHANCNQKDKPESQRRCFKICDWHLELFEWEVSAWDRCGLISSAGGEVGARACVTAQHGLQRRSVHCLQKLNRTIVPNEICEYFTPQPPAEQACLVPCPRDCVVSEFSGWSECGTGCAKSLQHRTRAVIAPPLYGGAPCPNLTESRACSTPACPLGEEEHTYSLRVGPWGECQLPHPKDIDLAGRTMPDLGADSGEPSTSGLQGYKPHHHPREVEIGYQTRQVRCVRSDGKNAALR